MYAKIQGNKKHSKISPQAYHTAIQLKLNEAAWLDTFQNHSKLENGFTGCEIENYGSPIARFSAFFWG
jgi:hypothetical protein